MQFLAVVALAAIGFAGGAPQREQAQAAGALWRILLNVRATGDFRTADESSVASVITDDQGFGSGFMVSPDGYLLTADHVVSPLAIARDACTNLKEEYTTVVARSIRVDYQLRDIVDNDVDGRIEILPTSADGNICANPEAITWKHDDVFPFRLVAREPAADLALLKLEVQDVAFIPTGISTLSIRDPLYALGFVESNRFTKATGIFIWWCEEVGDITEADGSIDRNTYRFMRMLVPVQAGMSGGPVMSGTSLVGITTVHTSFTVKITKLDGTSEEISEAGGYAVPGAYVHAWYLWASGQSTAKPDACQDPHKEADEPAPPSKKKTEPRR